MRQNHPGNSSLPSGTHRIEHRLRRKRRTGGCPDSSGLQKYDAVFMDMKMPVMNGLEAAGVL